MMASFGNVYVVALGVVDSEGNLIRLTQAVFESEEHGKRWAESERMYSGAKVAMSEWVMGTADGDWGHVEELVEDAWDVLEKDSAFIRAKRKMFRAVERSENLAALERARKILLGETDG